MWLSLTILQDSNMFDLHVKPLFMSKWADLEVPKNPYPLKTEISFYVHLCDRKFPSSPPIPTHLVQLIPNPPFILTPFVWLYHSFLCFYFRIIVIAIVRELIGTQVTNESRRMRNWKRKQHWLLLQLCLIHRNTLGCIRHCRDQWTQQPVGYIFPQRDTAIVLPLSLSHTHTPW